jgi:hypothetical protein
MTLTTILIIAVAIGSVIAGIILIKQSAAKFHLTQEQQKKVDERKVQQNQKDKDNE